MKTYKKGVIGLSSNRIVVPVITAVIVILGGTATVPMIVHPAFAGGLIIDDLGNLEGGLNAEIDQFTNNLIDSIFEDYNITDDGNGGLNVHEQQVIIDSEEGGANVIIQNSSSISGEDNNSVSTFMYDSQSGSFSDEVTRGGLSEGNFSAFVEDIITDSVDEGIVSIPPFFWW